MLHRTCNSTAHTVYAALRAKILSHQLAPAQRLLEVKIANELGVSRSPVREALRRLAGEGLVKIVPNSGARVAAPTVRDMEDACSLREYLENISVELACRAGLDKRALERLDTLAHGVESFRASGDLDGFLAANSSFHRIIAEAGKNYLLSEYVENVVQRTNVYIYLYKNNFAECEEKSADEHRAILRAIAKRDKTGAQALMKEHLLRIHETFREAALAKEKE